MPARSTPVAIPAPFGGMNTRDGLAVLKPEEARYLMNWTPIGNAVEIRKGYTEQSTGGVAGIVATLVPFNGLTSSKLVGINGATTAADLYDFSAASAAQIANSNYTVNRWQIENYGNRLIGVNGTDTPFTYDGSSSGATGFSGSGLTIANLINIRKVRNRLWFCEKSSADVWYGGLGAITGTLTKFQLSQVVSGGTCMAIGAHSSDAGDGADDLTVFVMSTGEVVVYSGDPSSTFAKVGNFTMPPPVGRKCLVSIGGQLAVLTRMGLVPVDAAFRGTAFDVVALGNFGKVSPSIQKDVEQFGGLDGWEMVFHNGLVVINVPTLTNAASRQWVYNVLTGAWTQWSLPAACLAVWGGNLYFGAWGVGTVWKYSGSGDNGASISTVARTSFTPPEGISRLVASMIRFDMAVDGQVSGRFGIDADFISGTIDIPSVTIAASSTSTPWGSPWGSAWSASTQSSSEWFGTYGEGRRLSVALEASVLADTAEWYSTQMLVEQGGAL